MTPTKTEFSTAREILHELLNSLLELLPPGVLPPPEPPPHDERASQGSRSGGLPLVPVTSTVLFSIHLSGQSVTHVPGHDCHPCARTDTSGDLPLPSPLFKPPSSPSGR